MTIWIRIITLFIAFAIMNCTETEKHELSTCFAHFGCINYTEEWYDAKHRPQNVPPLERHVVNTKFLYLTASPDSVSNMKPISGELAANLEKDTICYDLITTNPKDIKITNYESHYELMLLIHDFTSNGYTGWVKHMARELSILERYNVISVDWQEGAEPPYIQAISNARVVAMEIMFLLQTLLKEFDLVMGEVHIVGHGVGAHIAGYVGKFMLGRIGRITGLDPTGPYFEGMPPVVRLHHKDAMYVEVLHTDGDGANHQGTLEPMGNIDFYVNNGSCQPGCHNYDNSMNLIEVDREKLKEGRVLPDCSHKRAFKYYMEALGNTTCSFLALPVGTPFDIPLECQQPARSNRVVCATIGLDIDFEHFAGKVNAKYDLNTAPCNPFCRNRYQVVMDFVKCDEAEEESVGYFIVELTDEDGNSLNLTFNHGDSIHPQQSILAGQRITFSAWTAEPAMEKVSSMHITWHFTTPFCFMCRNATCVEQFSFQHVRSSASLADVPFTNYFCPNTCDPYIVLYDHVSNDQFLQCTVKRNYN